MMIINMEQILISKVKDLHLSQERVISTNIPKSTIQGAVEHFFQYIKFAGFRRNIRIDIIV